MKIIMVSASLILATPALAQIASPVEQSLGARLFQEMNISIKCGADLLTAQHDLAGARDRIKALEEKYEPKKPDPVEK